MEFAASGYVTPETCTFMYAASTQVHLLDPDLGIYAISAELEQGPSAYGIWLTKHKDGGYLWTAYWL